jgi:hypothetical protein
MADLNWDHYSDLPSPRAYAEPTQRPYIRLTRDEWNQIHNALCRAESMYESAFDVLKNGPEMREVLNSIRQSLAPAYRQDNDQFDRQFDLYRHVQDTHRFASIWSMYGITDFDAPHPFRSDVFVKYRDHWGDNKDRHYPVQGTTWLDVWRAADLAFQESGDVHNAFIAGFQQDPRDATMIYLQTGS